MRFGAQMGANMDDSKIICSCLDLTVKDVKTAIENGSTTVDEIMEVTQAGSICGDCIDEVREVAEELLKS